MTSTTEDIVGRKPPLPVWRKRLRRHVPITQWLTTYTSLDLLADAIAGLTLALTMIPQSIAYASLANLHPQYGLYSTFMGSFMYVFFGTIKEVSIGPTTLLALVTYENTKGLSYDFVILLTFCAGVTVLLMGIFRLGFLVDFISIPVTCGFQSAVAFIMVASQAKGLLGLRNKPGGFVDDIIMTSSKLPEIRWGDATLGLCSCCILLALRQLPSLRVSRKMGFKRFLWFVSISRNSCVVIACSIIAYNLENAGMEPFLLSGNMTSALPNFKLPVWTTTVDGQKYTFLEMLDTIKVGVVFISLVSVLANITIAKAFCNGAPVDATQEMMTLGICNIAGSLISSMPTSGAFTRSAVASSSGVRTPLAGVFSGSLILIVISFLAPYFYYIPRASLAAVLICAVIFMFDYKTMLLLWRSNKRDFFCCMTTFVACLYYNVEMGLIVGIVLNTIQLLYHWARPSISITIQETSAGVYYHVRPDVGLFFPAVDFLRSELQKRCIKILPVVVDCLHFKGIDYTTCQGIKEILKEFETKGQKILFVNMSHEIHNMLKLANVSITVRDCSYGEEEIVDILFKSGHLPECPSALLLADMDKEKAVD